VVKPGVFNITLQRGANYSILLELKDGSQAPINLTGWQVFAQAWNQARSTKYADFNVEYVDRPLGRIRLSLPYQATSALPSQAVYDVLLIDPNDIREYYLEGAITAEQNYTTAP
jgi:hypothetical protein